MAIERIERGPRMSQAVKGGGIVALAGQISEKGVSVADQAADILARIDALLAAAGSNKSKILSATIWLTDMADYDEFNRVWDKWIDPANPPARACIQARLVRPQWKVEIQVLALA